MMVRTYIFFFIIFSIFALCCSPTVISREISPRATVTTYDKNGAKTCTFSVEMAVTPEQISRGLMFREHLDSSSGMLFVFDREEIQNFWMVNTKIPLDIVFIRSSFRIVNVHLNATPFDQTTISSLKPTKYVLEINAGMARQCRIHPGNKISF